MDTKEWVARFSARLHAQWPRLAREDRDMLAEEMSLDARWAALEPESAAASWLGQGIPDASAIATSPTLTS